MSEIETAYRQIYEHHFPSMRFLADLGGPAPKAFHSAAELIINLDLHRALTGDTLDSENIRTLIETAKSWQVDIDNEGLAYEFKSTLEAMMEKLASAPDDAAHLASLVDAVALARSMPFAVDLWKAQNLYYEMMQNVQPDFQKRAQQGDEAARKWATQFASLGNQLLVRVA